MWTIESANFTPFHREGGVSDLFWQANRHLPVRTGKPTPVETPRPGQCPRL